MSPTVVTAAPTNEEIAEAFDEVGNLLAAQDANPFHCTTPRFRKTTGVPVLRNEAARSCHFWETSDGFVRQNYASRPPGDGTGSALTLWTYSRSGPPIAPHVATVIAARNRRHLDAY